MNRILSLGGFALAIALIFSSCAEDRNELQDLDIKGSTIDIVDNTPGFYNLIDRSTATNSFTIDNIKGENVNSLKVFKSFEGGSEVEVTTVTSFPAVIALPLSEAVEGLGVDIDDLEVGQIFTFSFDMTTPSGNYRAARTLNVAMSCPSTLAGDYDVVTTGQSTDVCCPDPVTSTSVVTLTDNGGGKYGISDWSGGIYFDWYAIYNITAESNIGEISDVCNEITFVTSTEPFGETLTATGTVDGPTGVITYSWVTGYGDAATCVLTPQ